ncbi:hypothetical protein DM469_03115 [Lactobacillus helveticus]|uniref:Phage protein n=2 Tax=Lactobacillus helveticus TaxID=1587 RepID=A0AAU8XX14_LACHE|nr:hypothetical protein [Lactobacillus helveticus]MDN6780039.1 hypothetical protein [Lactobacillus sp.]HBT85457.1 hypothetical protein [Porphyromonadaceae bacterium]AUI75290.1 hypothetical protein Lh8105_11100 [Lactobacillus helveticus]KXN80516.1 hypothetical protein AY470_04175 [Lactobacillus helveticus]MCT3424666.1 hypothetical protein [Lactobacillus helveticus]
MNTTQEKRQSLKKFCKLEAELVDEKGKINYNKLTPEQALKLKKVKNKMEASQLEIEEQLLKKNSPKEDSIRVEDIKKIRDDLFENELAGNGKTWQREGIDILLTKLGIYKENIY